MIHVTIVSPNPVLRIGLRGLLDGHSDVKVVGEAVSLEDLEQMETEVVLLASVSFARISEFDLNDRAILLLTDNQEDAKSLLRAKAGAWGVLWFNAAAF